ncbi:MAG: hypothetical protein EBX95_05125 [Acidimicrobiia bacterium]|nr:hypothetical protein [Acidimicrobiia bacterium]
MQKIGYQYISCPGDQTFVGYGTKGQGDFMLITEGKKFYSASKVWFSQSTTITGGGYEDSFFLKIFYADLNFRLV